MAATKTWLQARVLWSQWGLHTIWLHHAEIPAAAESNHAEIPAVAESNQQGLFP